MQVLEILQPIVTNFQIVFSSISQQTVFLYSNEISWLRFVKYLSILAFCPTNNLVETVSYKYCKRFFFNQSNHNLDKLRLVRGLFSRFVLDLIFIHLSYFQRKMISFDVPETFSCLIVKANRSLRLVLIVPEGHWLSFVVDCLWKDETRASHWDWKHISYYLLI